MQWTFPVLVYGEAGFNLIVIPVQFNCDPYSSFSLKNSTVRFHARLAASLL